MTEELMQALIADGKLAFSSGSSLNSSPHPRGTKEDQLWRMGWMEGAAT